MVCDARPATQFLVGLLGADSVGIVLAALLWLAHSWYPTECCNGNAMGGECHPIACESIDSRGDGMYVWQGLRFYGVMVRQSKDASCHVCHGWVNGLPAYPHCIFLQNMS